MSMCPRARRIALGLALALTILGAGACGGLIPGATGPAPDIYDLTPKSTFTDSLPSIGSQLVVEEPIASRGLDTDRIALRPDRFSVEYFAAARWSDRAPRMVQNLLIESFDNSRRIVAVGRQAVGLRPDFTLKTELREFQTEMRDEGPMVRVRLSVKIVRHPESRIIAASSFSRAVDIEDLSLGTVVEAFDTALGRVMRDSVEWTLWALSGQGSS